MHKRKTLELSIEKYLKKEVEAVGGVCLKLNPLWYLGIPDRLCVLPNGALAFVETKRPVGGRLSIPQKMWKKKLTALGCEWHMLSTTQQVDTFIAGVSE